MLVPVFLLLSYAEGNDAALGAFVVFIAASLSDFLDGYLARRMRIVSRTGEFLDPLADKLLIGAALVVLVATRDFPLWVAAVIGLREISVQVLRTQVVRAGGTLPSSNVAKAKTVIQISTVGWWLLPWSDINIGHWILLSATVAATIWSGVQYFAKAERTQPEEVTP